MDPNDEGGTDTAWRSRDQCPHCGSARYYLLADGRRKCRECRKKYSWSFRRESLGSCFREEAARMFWEMVPARKAAQSLGTNRKTMQRYYGLMRRAIALEQETGRQDDPAGHAVYGSSFAGDEEALLAPGPVVFWLFAWTERLQVVFPAKRSPFGRLAPIRDSAVAVVVVYAPGGAELERLALDRFRQRTWWRGDFRAEKAGEPRLERFWMFAKDRLRRYRGGYQANFPLFVREMVFRFSEHDAQKALEFLRRSLDIEPGTDQHSALEEKNP